MWPSDNRYKYNTKITKGFAKTWSQDLEPRQDPENLKEMEEASKLGPPFHLGIGRYLNTYGLQWKGDVLYIVRQLSMGLR